MKSTCVSLCVLFLLNAQSIAQDNDRKEIELAAKMMEANRNSFRRYKCEYEYFLATAKSIQDIRDGIFFNKESLIYTLTVDLDLDIKKIANNTQFRFPKPTKENTTRGPDGNMKVQDTFSNHYECRISHSGTFANLFPPFNQLSLNESADEAHQPFNFFLISSDNRYSPNYLLSRRLTRWKLLRNESKESNLIQFKLWQDPPNTINRTFKLDPNQGYIPVETIDYDVSIDSKDVRFFYYQVLETKFFCNLGFFPVRIVQFFKKEDGTCFVYGMTVSNILIGDDVKKEDFELRVPEGTQVKNGKSHFYTKQFQIIYPEQIPELKKALEK